MEEKEVDGMKFVKNYNPEPMARWQMALLLFCFLALGFFITKLAGLI
jgi:hypothetical protein